MEWRLYVKLRFKDLAKQIVHFMNWIFAILFPIGIFLFSPSFEALHSFAGTSVNDPKRTEATQQEPSEAYFIGYSYNPSWYLTIFPDSIIFISDIAGFESLYFPHQDPEKDALYSIKRYHLQSDEGQMTIAIGLEACTLESSNESFAYSLNLEIKHLQDTAYTQFIGCGRYITNASLQGRWIVAQIEDKPVDAEAFNNNLPSLEIVPDRNSFSGFSGCNKINGRLFAAQNLLRFTDIVSTKMSCDNLNKEIEFMEALQFSTQFVVEDDRLILSNPLNTTLILQRE